MWRLAYINKSDRPAQWQKTSINLCQLSNWWQFRARQSSNPFDFFAFSTIQLIWVRQVCETQTQKSTKENIDQNVFFFSSIFHDGDVHDHTIQCLTHPKWIFHSKCGEKSIIMELKTIFIARTVVRFVRLCTILWFLLALRVCRFSWFTCKCLPWDDRIEYVLSFIRSARAKWGPWKYTM